MRKIESSHIDSKRNIQIRREGKPATKKSLITDLIIKDLKEKKLNFKGNFRRSNQRYIMESLTKRQRHG